MLEHALKVVDAVRQMRLIEKKGRTSSGLNQLELAKSIEGLRLALESFDKNSGSEVSGPDLVAKPEFATPPQLTDEGQLLSELNLSPDFAPRPNSGELSELEELELEAKEKVELAATAGVVAAVILPTPRRRPTTLAEAEEDLSDGIYIEGDESTEEMELAIGALNEKLNYAVKKIGWNPKLRALAESARLANSKISLEYEHKQLMVKVPAQIWGRLSLAMTEAAIDQDVSIKMPTPKPRRAPENEYENISRPKPPANW